MGPARKGRGKKSFWTSVKSRRCYVIHKLTRIFEPYMRSSKYQPYFSWSNWKKGWRRQGQDGTFQMLPEEEDWTSLRVTRPLTHVSDTIIHWLTLKGYSKSRCGQIKREAPWRPRAVRQPSPLTMSELISGGDGTKYVYGFRRRGTAPLTVLGDGLDDKQ